LFILLLPQGWITATPSMHGSVSDNYLICS